MTRILSSLYSAMCTYHTHSARIRAPYHARTECERAFYYTRTPRIRESYHERIMCALAPSWFYCKPVKVSVISNKERLQKNPFSIPSCHKTRFTDKLTPKYSKFFFSFCYTLVSNINRVNIYPTRNCISALRLSLSTNFRAACHAKSISSVVVSPAYEFAIYIRSRQSDW